jgi:TonB family protein
MRAAKIVIALLFGILLCHSLTAEQVPTTQTSSAGRFWTMSELDTMKSHKWIWMDESLKERAPESLLVVKGKDDLPIPRKIAVAKYPEEALKRGVQADVRLRVLINKEGNVRGAYILQDSGHDSLGFEETALEVAKRCTWQAAEGKKWKGNKWVSTLHRFRLSDQKPVEEVGFSWWTEDEEQEPSLATPPFETTAKARGPYDQEEFPTAPSPINLTPPEYPAPARTLEQQAVICVRVFIDEAGKPSRSEITMKTCSPEYGFEKSGLAATLKGTWKPAMLRGKPMAAWVSYKIEWQLKIH